MSETNNFNSEPPTPQRRKEDKRGYSMTPLGKYNRAHDKRVDLPVPGDILRNPSVALLQAYKEVRRPLDAFWHLLSHEADMATKREPEEDEGEAA